MLVSQRLYRVGILRGVTNWLVLWEGFRWRWDFAFLVAWYFGVDGVPLLKLAFKNRNRTKRKLGAALPEHQSYESRTNDQDVTNRSVAQRDSVQPALSCQHREDFWNKPTPAWKNLRGSRFRSPIKKGYFIDIPYLRPPNVFHNTRSRIGTHQQRSEVGLISPACHMQLARIVGNSAIILPPLSGLSPIISDHGAWESIG